MNWKKYMLGCSFPYSHQLLMSLLTTPSKCLALSQIMRPFFLLPRNPRAAPQQHSPLLSVCVDPQAPGTNPHGQKSRVSHWVLILGNLPAGIASHLPLCFTTSNSIMPLITLPLQALFNTPRMWVKQRGKGLGGA